MTPQEGTMAEERDGTRARMRVVMPVLNLVPGGVGGSETYTRALVKELDSRPDVELQVVVSRRTAGAIGAEHEIVAARVSGGHSTGARIAALVSGSVADRTVRSALGSADVVHYPLTVPIPLIHKPWVHTLLDVQHLDLPEMFSWAERQYRKATYDLAARRARRVITISEFSRRRISENLSIPPERIDVAPLGVDLAHYTPSSGERDPFLLFPAAVWPHKNHARLFEAMRVLHETRPELTLVLTGGRRSRLGRLPAWVEHRGFVDDEELRALYARAACLVFPSLYEGFGLPPLEAMARGCPVAVSNAGSLPEICGDAAITFDPENVNDMASAIERAMRSGDRLRDRGVERARRFTWEACAAAHLASYSTLLRPRPREFDV
jgi:glycosyltransferase involved in cell wall biosynthesis